MKLSSDQAGALLSQAVSFNHDRSPLAVINAAVDQLRKEYKELIATLDSEEDWSTRLAAWAQLNIPVEHSGLVTSDIFTAGAYLETGLLALLDAGTLLPVIVTTESARDLAQLRRSVAYHNLFPKAITEEAAVQVPEPVAVDPIDQCIADYRSMASGQFRKVWMSGNARAIFDRAVAEGKI